ncbi:uncharacterized protein LOC132628613 [Lycium barbarum]|uniref:uncharacterized protein LOC132628613 n=1 Tax=Lycium barbarum TaxID=112863 RepID=UPI00293F7013|nr:uncharacterized protein LOC132628613 [Lycium barbarum]
MTYNYKGWHEQLPYALLGYCTMARTSIGATPYLLVYGTKVVIPTEVEITSLRIIQDAKFHNDEWVRARYEQLALIDEKRIVGMVLKIIFPHQNENKGKFAPKWKGPYVVRKVLSRGAVVLAEMDGKDWTKPINSGAIKRYYA